MKKSVLSPASSLLQACSKRTKVQCLISTSNNETTSDRQKEDQDEGSEHATHQSYLVRSGNNKPLPLSSFLDPSRLAQRHRHRMPKPRATKYKDLDAFRQRFASNPYAHLLASTPRRCAATEARLPSSFLLTLHTLRSPNPPHNRTLLPLLLHRAAQIPPTQTPSAHSDSSPAPPPRSLSTSHADHLVPRPRLLRAVVAAAALPRREHRAGRADSSSGGSSLLRLGTGQGSRPSLALPARFPDVVASLLRGAVMRALRFPLRSGGADAPVALGEGGLAELNGVPRVAAVLFFGSRRAWNGERVREMERRVDESGARVEAAVQRVLRWYRQIEWKGAPARPLVLAQPRARFPVLNLPTVEYCDASSEEVDAAGAWVPREYPVPVLPMVDILGEDKARELIANTRLEGATWVVLRPGPMFTSALGWVLRGAWWFLEE